MIISRSPLPLVFFEKKKLVVRLARPFAFPAVFASLPLSSLSISPCVHVCVSSQTFAPLAARSTPRAGARVLHYYYRVQEAPWFGSYCVLLSGFVPSPLPHAVPVLHICILRAHTRCTSSPRSQSYWVECEVFSGGGGGKEERGTAAALLLLLLLLHGNDTRTKEPTK